MAYARIWATRGFFHFGSMESPDDHSIADEGPSLPARPIAGPSAFWQAQSEATTPYGSGSDADGDDYDADSASFSDSQYGGAETVQGGGEEAPRKHCTGRFPSVVSMLGYFLIFVWVPDSCSAR